MKKNPLFKRLILPHSAHEIEGIVCKRMKGIVCIWEGKFNAVRIKSVNKCCWKEEHVFDAKPWISTCKQLLKMRYRLTNWICSFEIYMVSYSKRANERMRDRHTHTHAHTSSACRMCVWLSDMLVSVANSAFQHNYIHPSMGRMCVTRTYDWYSFEWFILYVCFSHF